MKKALILFFFLIGILLLAIWGYISTVNNYQQDGTLQISINDQPIKINRDENGIAYVFAENKADVIRGQGFVTAQDRLFQIEFYRAMISGQLAHLVGPSMVASDIKMRVLNLSGNAKKSYQYFDEDTKNFIKWYCEGFNEYLKVGKDEFPIELSLLGIEPKPMTSEEIVSVMHFVGLFHSQNMDDEILSLNLAARTDKAKDLLPLAINLDRTKPITFTTDSMAIGFSKKLDLDWQELVTPMLPYPKLGSNNWAISGKKSKSGKPILCNDPHVDGRMLPGTFYPVGLFCPAFKGVGIAPPGIPGLLAGRTEYVSFGITNAYGDSQDLFIEETSGDFYMEGEQKIPFQKRKETIYVKDSANVEIEIRSTNRGPIISDFRVFGIMTKDVVSLRWSLAETQSSSIGFEKLMEAKNVSQFQKALEGMDNMFFNYALADVEGNIAHQSTGLVPIRRGYLGEVPQMASNGNTWLGFIPKNEMPNMVNPVREWIGTSNQDTRPDDYPYYYSGHFSPYYRYKRQKEVFGQTQKMDANDLWELIFDVKNMQAEEFTPIFIAALAQNPETTDLANTLKNWDYTEEVDDVAATIYNVLYNELVYLILNDELPDEVEDMYWSHVYYWNQRIDEFIRNDHPFIDNVNTEKKETLTDLIQDAGVKAKALLTKRLGSNQSEWAWGKVHTVRFFSPIKSKGFGSEFLGAELIPKSGSNQTLNRGGFVKNTDRNFETSWFSSYRMVADMADNEKVMGVLSGGSAARIFHPYHKSQLDEWKMGKWIPYWLSEDKVLEHSEHKLILE